MSGAETSNRHGSVRVLNMPGQVIRIEFSYTVSEYVEALRVGVFRASPNLVAWMCLAFVATVGGPLIVFSSYPNDDLGVIIGGIAAGVGAWYTFPLVVTLWRAYLGGQRGFQAIQGNIEIQFDEANIAIRGPRGVSQAPWKTFDCALETPNLYLLSQVPGMWVMIPKRAFASEQVAPFGEMLSRAVPVTQSKRAASRGFWITLVIGVAFIVVSWVILRAMNGN
jgi:YcxB-like protein